MELTDAKVRYKIDFSFTENGKTVFAEAKGVRGARWIVLERLWPEYGPAELRVYYRAKFGAFGLSRPIKFFPNSLK